MMKKLLVLGLLLCLIPAANAGVLGMNVDGSTTPDADGLVNILQGGTATIYLIGAQPARVDLLEMAKGYASMTQPVPNGAYPVQDNSGEENYSFALTLTNPPAMPAIVFTTTVTAISPVGNTFDVYLINGTNYSTINTIHFTVVPEPITLGLLGLGGLFLRRRK